MKTSLDLQSTVQRVHFSFTQPKPAKLRHIEMAKNKKGQQGLPVPTQRQQSQFTVTCSADKYTIFVLKKTMTNISAIDYPLQISLAFNPQAFTFTNVNHLHSSLISPSYPTRARNHAGSPSRSLLLQNTRASGTPLTDSYHYMPSHQLCTCALLS